MATAWDAFISYARAASGPTAVQVQRGLERFARPWHQRRAVRIFRDDSAMSTNPALWSAIEAGLAGAGHLIVLLSPGARDSAYVDKEVAWWLEHKGAGSILLVLDDGELVWDAAGNRFTDDSPVPPSLRAAFSEEPRWLDLRWLRNSPAPAADPRFASAMADLSAPVRGLPRDELVGEDLTQHRRVRRLARTAVSSLVLLLASSIVATVIAVQQRDDVLRQAVTLRSRELAGASSGLLGSDLRLAQLLAVQGYRTERSPATREALRQAAFASPLIERFATFDADITAIATSADAGTVAVALADGRVLTLGGGGTGRPELRFTAAAAVTALRANADGTVLLAATAAGVSVWDRSGSRPLADGPGLVGPQAVALSPSGRRAAVAREDETVELVTYDTASGRELGSRADPFVPEGEVALYPRYTERLGFVGEHTLQLVGNDANWLQLDLRTGRTRRSGGVPWLPYANLYVASDRADYLLSAPIANGQAVRAWPLSATGRNPKPVTAPLQFTDPLGMAISPDGSLVLLNDSASGLSVAPVAGDQPAVVSPTRIPGLGAVGAMAFLTPERAVAAARTELAFLAFGGPGRGAEGLPLAPRGVGGVPEYAIDFRSSRLAVSPDGSRVAVLELNSAALQVVALPGRGGATLPNTPVSAADELQTLFGPVWLGNETVLVLGAEEPVAGDGLPAGVLRWDLGLAPLAEGGERQLPLAAGAFGEGTVLVATSGGVVQTRQVPSGTLLGEVGRPAEGTEYDQAVFTADGGHLALVRSGGQEGEGVTLRVLDTGNGQVVHEREWQQGAAVAGLAFAGSTLLVSHLDGSVDILDDLGRGATSRISTTGTRTSTGSVQGYPPVVGSDGLVGVPTRSGLQLYDLGTRQPAGVLPVPPGFETVPRAYAFGPDGHTLVTGFFGADPRTATLTVRDLDPEAVADAACRSAGGAISAAQWMRVVGTELPVEPACG